ncbi:histidine phosphatase family protein [Sporobolomyces salmoneus]|uniref:histidine phosphatase family protein n=1 Tax=Sporobolomyces salmoneus TaxID=183962 RepID=UPI003170F8D5
MTLKTIYVARHGFRLSWETQTWTSPTGVPRDPPLSAHGVDQAKELAAFLKDEVNVTKEDIKEGKVMLFSSPLYRCVQTAKPTSETLSLPIHIEDGLGEWYLPVRKGLHPALSTSQFLGQFFPPSLLAPHDSPSFWTPLLTPPRTGESMYEIHVRAVEFLKVLVPRLEELGVEKVIVFSHAATCIALSRALAGDLGGLSKDKEGKEWNEEERLACRAATCSVSKFERKEGEKVEWERVWNGKTDFLKGGEERHWEFSFVEEYEEDGLLDDGTEAGKVASDNYKGLPNEGKKESTATTTSSHAVEGKL